MNILVPQIPGREQTSETSLGTHISCLFFLKKANNPNIISCDDVIISHFGFYFKNFASPQTHKFIKIWSIFTEKEQNLLSFVLYVTILYNI